MGITVESVQAALKEVIDPNLVKDLVSARCIRNIQIDGNDVSMDLELGYPGKSQIDGLRKSIISRLRSVPEMGNVSVNGSVKIVAHAV